MSTIINVNFVKSYSVELALRDAIMETIHTFDDRMSLVSLLGIFEVIKSELLEDAK